MLRRSTPRLGLASKMRQMFVAIRRLSIDGAAHRGPPLKLYRPPEQAWDIPSRSAVWEGEGRRVDTKGQRVPGSACRTSMPLFQRNNNVDKGRSILTAPRTRCATLLYASFHAARHSLRQKRHASRASAAGSRFSTHQGLPLDGRREQIIQKDKETGTNKWMGRHSWFSPAGTAAR